MVTSPPPPDGLPAGGATDGAPVGATDGAAARARRLADWCDSLGITEQLGAAGLPSVQRGPDGAVTWLDPGTGAPLGAEQLLDLDRVLHGQGEDPRHAVPVALLQLARQAKVREELLGEPWHSYVSLARLRGASEAATRFAVHKAASTHRLLVVSGGTTTTTAMVPAFQLDDGGEVRAELVAVLDPLLSAGMDPWRAWAWLTRPAALLGGLVPEQAAADPEHLDLVVGAAIRLAERVRLS